MAQITKNVVFEINAGSDAEAKNMLSFLNEFTSKVPAIKITKLLKKVRKEPEKRIDEVLKLL